FSCKCPLVVFQKLLRPRSVSSWYSLGIKGKRREPNASGVYFYGESNFHCLTSIALVVGRAHRITQIEVKPTLRNGSRMLSTSLCLVLDGNFAYSKLRCGSIR